MRRTGSSGGREEVRDALNDERVVGVEKARQTEEEARALHGLLELR